MNSKNTAFQETRTILLGQILCTAAMIAVFAVLGYYQFSVLLGGIAGALIATANYFFMSFFANRAADKAEAQDVAGGQKLMKSSYPIRLLVLAGLLILCAKSGVFDVIALVLPLLFVRPVLTIAEFFRKKGV